MTAIAASIPEILADVPSRFRGPGGAVAVLKDGELVGQRCWGYADLHSRTPMAADTVLPICSITKQMLCGLLTDLERNPTPAMKARGEDPAKQLSDQLAHLLHPDLLRDSGLTMRHLGNMQSGLRDYWALTVLWGAKPEGHFSIADHGPQMLARLKSFHFPPGTEYSYANTNFFILGRCIERVTGQTLEELLSQRIFGPAGMETARLCAHSAKHPPPGVGYEGNEEFGFYPGINCIEWAGDAGAVASLNDMIAYEKLVDRSRGDAQSWYGSNSEPQTYNDGTPADYGFGLARQLVGGVLTVRHGGALRGYRLSRSYSPDPRLSIVVLLNQEHGDAGGVSDYILKRAMGVPEARNEVVEAGPDWVGTYLDSETGLAITVSRGAAGEIFVKYHRKGEKLRVVEVYRAQSDGMVATLDGTSLHLHVPPDNRTIHAQRVADVKPAADFSALQGEYRCAEIDSTFHCSGSGDMLYGMFDGFLGFGPVHMMRSLGEDLWALACPRAMDSTPPGDWTVVVRRGDDGKVAGLTIGCWLARRLEFVKQGE
ncbi:beta-lactamase-type transpeptidase fold domain-containing protein [Xylariomycetidae sp. FL2044]|nr:beta-lactamase-type transpeptidase fold domain-containing protein [Xylariomycetidae sp. FL2044]